jgi:predicted ATPase
MQPPVIEFGPFRFDRMRREVSDDSGTLRLGSRALEILGVLLESPGRLFSRDEIVARVWPRSVVEDTNLRVHMSALRRTLGDGQHGARYIENVPGRGYVFIGAARAAAAPAAAPSTLTQPIGRDDVIAQLVELLSHQRLVSIVGAGGMGKTTVANAAAERLRGQYEGGVHFVDLSRITSPSLVAAELGQALGHNVSLADPVPTLQRLLHGRRMLIVMDNCEHVIDAAAHLVDALTRLCPGLRFLATSREPLAIEAEWVLKLAPLAVPAPHEQFGTAQVLAFAAVQLFVARAKATCAGFEFDDATAPSVRALCEALDGIPLAIELAAARVDSLGVAGLLQRIESVFELLTRGRRTALSRHRTLDAVLAWSYELLSAREQQVLQRLSVFRGAFDIDGAVALAGHGDRPRHEVVDDVLSLCSKSLIASQPADDGSATHRLLYITRLYAEKQLDGSPDEAECHRRHAAFILQALLRAQQAGLDMSVYRWSPALGSSIADVRAAIDWALVAEHDLALGMKLTVAALRPYRDVGLVEEYRHRVDAAIGKLPRLDDDAARAPLELQLQVAAAFMSSYRLDGGPGREELDRVRALASSAADVEDRIEALLGLGIGAVGLGDYQRLLALCGEVRTLATGACEPLSIVIADRLSAMALHALGQHDDAEPLALKVMAQDGAKVGRRFLSEVPVAVSMRVQLARLHWLRGAYGLAWNTLLEALERTRGEHVFARVQALGISAIPLALWRGDLALATQWADELLATSTSKGLRYWQVHGMVFQRLAGGREVGYGSEESLLMARCAPLQDLAATLQACRPGASTLARVESGAVGWCAPEVLRLSALDALRHDDAALRARGAATLQRAAGLAELQGARFWMLRTALTMCTHGAGIDWGFSPLERLRGLLACAPHGVEPPELAAARRLCA